MDKKLVVVVMGQDCENTIGMCLESVKDADAIIYCDGGSKDGTKNILLKAEGIINTIHNSYDQEDPAMNGKQRNFYLEYLKKNFPGWWCLAIDADEVVDDLSKIKQFINMLQPETEDILFSPKMRHLVGDLGHEDATLPEHFVPHRLFKISDNLKYTEVEHSLLTSPTARTAQFKGTTIWHLREVMGVLNTKNKYNWNLKKSNMHSQEDLRKWYMSMLSGTYPKSKVELWELPKAIREEFKL